MFDGLRAVVEYALTDESCFLKDAAEERLDEFLRNILKCLDRVAAYGIRGSLGSASTVLATAYLGHKNIPHTMRHTGNSTPIVPRAIAAGPSYRLIGQQKR